MLSLSSFDSSKIAISHSVSPHGTNLKLSYDGKPILLPLTEDESPVRSFGFSDRFGKAISVALPNSTISFKEMIHQILNKVKDYVSANNIPVKTYKDPIFTPDNGKDSSTFLKMIENPKTNQFYTLISLVSGGLDLTYEQALKYDNSDVQAVVKVDSAFISSKKECSLRLAVSELLLYPREQAKGQANFSRPRMLKRPETETEIVVVE